VAIIIGAHTFDARFPTSAMLDGSEPMNPDPGDSATYLVLRTDVDRLAGHPLAFTIAIGNEVQRAAPRRPRAHRRRALGTGSARDVDGHGHRRSPRLPLSRRREMGHRWLTGLLWTRTQSGSRD
jgi:hypothetical protein